MAAPELFNTLVPPSGTDTTILYYNPLFSVEVATHTRFFLYKVSHTGVMAASGAMAAPLAL